MSKLILAVIMLMIAITLIGKVSADSIGYEFLDNDTLYIYNNGTPSDWFYFGSCGNNLLNNINNSWEVISMSGAYGNDLDQAINNKREFTPNECERVVKSDNLTFVNVTFTNNINFQGRDVRYRKEGYITLNDDYMREKFSAKNIGNPPINFPLWFFLERHNISISATPTNDLFAVPLLNGTKEYYMINENNTDLRFNGSAYQKGFFLIDMDTQENINFVHNYSGEWYHILDNQSVYSAFRVADSLQRDESIIIDTWFQDATRCSCMFGSSGQSLIACPDGDCKDTVGGDFNMECRHDVLVGSCTGCTMSYMRGNPLLGWIFIPATGTPLDCSGVLCRYTDNYGTPVNRNIDCEGVYQTAKYVGCQSNIPAAGTAYAPTECLAAPEVPEEDKPIPLPVEFMIYKPQEESYLYLLWFLLGAI